MMEEMTEMDRQYRSSKMRYDVRVAQKREEEEYDRKHQEERTVSSAVETLIMRDGIATDGVWTQMGSRRAGTFESCWPAHDEPMLFFDEEEGRYFKGWFDGEVVIDEDERGYDSWGFLWYSVNIAPTDRA